MISDGNDDNFCLKLNFLPLNSLDSQLAFEKFFLEDEQEFGAYLENFKDSQNPESKDYNLFVILDHFVTNQEKKQDFQDLKKRNVLFFGKKRTFWINLSFDEFMKSNSGAKDALSRIIDQISLILELGTNSQKLLEEKQRIEDTLNSNLRIPNNFQKYSLNFHLINSDPQFYKVDWNFEKIKNRILLPFLKTIRNVYKFDNIDINSDLKYFGNLDPSTFKIKNEIAKNKFLAPQFDPATKKFKVFGVDLQNIVLENDHWIIQTPTDSNPQLHFFIYLTNKKYNPLEIIPYSFENSNSNSNSKKNGRKSFVIPQFGGIVFHNPVLNPEGMLEENEMEKLLFEEFSIIMKQLRTLLDVNSPFFLRNSKYLDFKMKLVPETKIGISEWEVDALKRKNSRIFLKRSINSLVALSKTFNAQPELSIPESVVNSTKNSILCIERITKLSNNSRVLEEILENSQKSMFFADQAFFDPKITTTLFYSWDQKAAILFPLIGPIALNVLKACFGIFKEWRRKKNGKKDPKPEEKKLQIMHFDK